MENKVNLPPAEVLLQVELREVARDHIALVALEVLEVAGTKVVDHGDVGLGIAAGDFVDQVRADKAGPAGDDDVLVHGATLHKSRRLKTPLCAVAGP